MEISPIGLLQMLLASMGFGVLLGLGYDVTCLIRMLLGTRSLPDLTVRLLSRRGIATPAAKHPRADACLVFFFDVLLMLFAACGVAVVNYTYNRGIWRTMTVGGTLCGFILYRVGPSAGVMTLLGLLSRWFRICLRWVCMIVSLPLRAAAGALKKICKKVASALAKRRNIRYNKREQERLLAMARRGFCENGEGEGG